MPTRKATWKSKDQFNHTSTGAPVFDKVEIIGEDDTAYLALVSKGQPTENIDFSTPAEYTYDDTKVRILGGKATLKAVVAGEENWPFVTPGNYIYDSDKIEVAGGVAKLKGTPYIPYAQWHMNEVAGSNVPDCSGNDRHGTCVNMEDVNWVPGKLNNCLRIGDGGDCEYVDCGGIAAFDRLDAFSLEIWLKTTSMAWPTFIGKMVSTTIRTGYEFGFQSGVLRLRLINTLNTNSIVVRNNTPISNGLWHHVIVTYDGSSLASGVKFYVDGILCSGNIDDKDNLTNSILNGSSLWLGYRTSTSYFDGYLDEVVIYEKELVQVEVDVRYNSGMGTEDFLGSYAKDNPPIVPSVGLVFSNPLGSFQEIATKPGSEIKYHISFSDGVTWKYWDGSNWVVTDGTYAQSNTVTDINANINDLAGSGTFKFRALLHSNTGAKTPEVANIYIAEGISYTLIPQEITQSNSIQPANVFQWISLAETVTKPTGTGIKYQYSIDDGVLWNNIWLTEPELESVLYALVLVGDGTDTLKIKFQLVTTDSLQTPEIDNLGIVYETGYEDSGSYISTGYYPRTSWVGTYVGKISFDIENFPGTSVIIHARAIAEVLEDNYNQPWTIYNNGDAIAICGYMMQWYVEFATTNPANTPKLNSLDIEFHPLIGTLRTMDATVQDTQEKIIRILGLSQENYYLDQTFYTTYQGAKLLTSGRIRIYSNAGAVGTDNDVVATYTIASNWLGDELQTYKVTKQ